MILSLPLGHEERDARLDTRRTREAMRLPSTALQQGHERMILSLPSLKGYGHEELDAWPLVPVALSGVDGPLNATPH